MRVTVFGTRAHEREVLEMANAAVGHDLVFRKEWLTEETAILARGSTAVCLFSGDRGDRPTLEVLKSLGVRLLALRTAGFNHVDLAAADALGLTVLRVPAYSPSAVAEHAVALLMTLNRKTHRAYNRVREQNFSLDGLLGYNVEGKTVGVVGTGKIGEAFARILRGFGARLIGFDPAPRAEVEAQGLRYVSLETLWRESDIISLHCPLTPRTRHLVNAEALALTQPGLVLLNTSRGAVIETRAVIDALKTGRLGALGLDVYEEEGDLFYRDLSDQVIQDDTFVRLSTFPNVLITGHQGFFTREAMVAIATTTIANLTSYEQGAIDPANQVTSAEYWHG